MAGTTAPQQNLPRTTPHHLKNDASLCLCIARSGRLESSLVAFSLAGLRICQWPLQITLNRFPLYRINSVRGDQLARLGNRLLQ